jgi:hypothetical protein
LNAILFLRAVSYKLAAAVSGVTRVEEQTPVLRPVDIYARLAALGAETFDDLPV